MQFSLDIVNEKGLHARASAKFVETVERFDARARVGRDGMEVSGDSIMGLMMLGAACGTSIDVWVEGADAEPLATLRRPPRLAVLFGSEAQGLDPATVAACDRRVTIPMQLGTDSLNVTIAAAIVLHHLTHVALPRER